MKKTILKIKNLNISFYKQNFFSKQEKTIIKDFNLIVKEKEIVAIVGASGSGKSLLLHSILNILPKNTIVTGNISTSIKDIGFIPQSLSFLNPLIKVGNQITKGEENFSTSKKCKKILKTFNLDPEILNLYPFQLSGGTCRRTLISTALFSSSKLILADEPSPGIDSKTLHHISNHLKKIVNYGTSILLITHDINFAMTTADKILILFDGISIEEIPSSNFSDVTLLNHPYTKALFYSMPENGFYSFGPISKKDTGCFFANHCSFAKSECKKIKIPWKKTKFGFVRCLFEKEEKNVIGNL